MPVLLAGGACWAAEGLAEDAGAVVFAAGAGAGAAAAGAGAGCVGAAGEVDPAVAVFADLGCFAEEALDVAAVVSALSGFLDLEDFLEMEASVEVVESADLDLDLEAVVDVSEGDCGAVASELLDFDLDFEVVEAASEEDWEVDASALLDLDFDFDLDLAAVSPWSADCVDWGDCGLEAAPKQRVPAVNRKATSRMGQTGRRREFILEWSFRHRRVHADWRARGRGVPGQLKGRREISSRGTS